MEISSLIRDGIYYVRDNNLFHFIDNDEERPEWSKLLNKYFANNPDKMQMKQRYDLNCKKIDDDNLMQDFFRYITEEQGVIVDLASGPSGYFAPVFNFLKDNSIFIATDACKSVIEAHRKVNLDERFNIFDLNLDKDLPFKEGSVNAFSGNLLDNVDNYIGLLSEIGRCLKHNKDLTNRIVFFEKQIARFKNMAPASDEESREVLRKVQTIQDEVLKDTAEKMVPYLKTLEKIIKEGMEYYNAGNGILWDWHTSIRPFDSNGMILQNGKSVPLPSAPTRSEMNELRMWFGHLFDEKGNLVFRFADEIVEE